MSDKNTINHLPLIISIILTDVPLFQTAQSSGVNVVLSDFEAVTIKAETITHFLVTEFSKIQI